MVSLAANLDPAGRRECNDAHLHGGIELDDRPDLLRGWRRFDYGHRIPVGNTGSRMNTRRACAGRPQWRNYRARPRPRKTQRGGALCPGPRVEKPWIANQAVLNSKELTSGSALPDVEGFS